MPQGSGDRRVVQGLPYPVLVAEQCDACWKVWCDFCRRHHHHAEQPGHRAAHCRSERSPYYQRGYIIVAPVTDKSA